MIRTTEACLVLGMAMTVVSAPTAAPEWNTGLGRKVAEKVRTWKSGGQPLERLQASASAPDGPRPAGIWVAHPVPGLSLPKGGKLLKARLPGSPRSWKEQRGHLHNLEISRSQDGDLNDYRVAMREAADAARAHQDINYIPLLPSRVVYGRLDRSGNPVGGSQEYFGVVPQRASARSQLVTFGMRPEFGVTGGAAAPESAELVVNGRVHELKMGGTALVSFPGPGTYQVGVVLKHADGAVRESEFDFEIKTLPDGSYFNSTVDGTGKIGFKIGGGA